MTNPINGQVIGQKKPWYQNPGWITLLIIISVSVFGLTSFITTSNRLNTQSQAVDEQLGQVQTVLQRRADLIPNLVNSVKGQQKHETKIYTAIANARKSYYGAQTKYQKASQTHDQSSQVTALGQQEAALNLLVGSVKEAYPKLSSQSDMQTLMVELEGSENRISVERHKYNQFVQQYNNTVVRFPGSVVASMTNHHPMSYFKATPQSQTAPDVKF